MNKDLEMNKDMKETNALKPIILFCAIAFGFSWAIWIGAILGIPGIAQKEDDRFGPFFLLGSFGPTIAALVTTGIFEGKTGIMRILKSLIKVKVDWKVYALTFFAFPAIGIVFYLLCGIKIAPGMELYKIVITTIPLMPINALMAGVVFGAGPLGEEAGWRGFLQAKLENRGNSFIVFIVIGILWAVWHLPIAIFMESFRNGLSLPLFCFLFPLSTILVSWSMARLWKWSRGSVFIAIFFHAVMNSMADNYLVNEKFWVIGGFTNLQKYLLVVAVFALTAVLFEIMDRTLFRKAKSGTAA